MVNEIGIRYISKMTVLIPIRINDSIQIWLFVISIRKPFLLGSAHPLYSITVRLIAATKAADYQYTLQRNPVVDF